MLKALLDKAFRKFEWNFRAFCLLAPNDATQTTWVSDANLFQTQAAGNANLVADIIAANSGVIHDSVYPFHSGTYLLHSYDFTTSTGTMDWFGAQAWIGYLNKTSHDGYNQTGSQMGELCYNELGGVAGENISNTHNANYNLFTNVQNSVYWSGSEYTFNPSYAWDFTGYGGQRYSAKGFQSFAWAVHPGDISAVPVPGAIWLFGSGLLGLFGINRRKTV